MAEATAISDVGLQTVIGQLREDFRETGYLQLKWKNRKGRSLDQNAISHAWYQQMAREDRQEDTRGHRRYCKLHHGVPILRAEDADYREAYDAVIKPLPYPLKLQAMDHWPVTSLMTTKQLSAYLDDVKDDYKRRRSVELEYPQQEAA